MRLLENFPRRVRLENQGRKAPPIITSTRRMEAYLGALCDADDQALSGCSTLLAEEEFGEAEDTASAYVLGVDEKYWYVVVCYDNAEDRRYRVKSPRGGW